MSGFSGSGACHDFPVQLLARVSARWSCSSRSSQASDFERSSKPPERFGSAVAYADSAANLRYYEPDFVAVTADGIYHLIETKGREDVDVALKDRAARLWCENATLLTGTEWRYKKIPHSQQLAVRLSRR